ncbi:MAG: hypothetical protein OXC37_06215 [Bdellovibrionaceae bacterium]|nr:hypothetical protein [Pseudobdellovibrionaceae bacterium]
MERKSKLKQFIFSLPVYLIGISLISPFLLFLFKLKTFPSLENLEFLFVFFMTVFQSSASAFLSLFLGILAVRGLLSVSDKKYYFVIEAFVLIPCLIPPLILALSLVHLVELITVFPFGLTALIISQTLTYIGLCSIALARILKKQGNFLSEWAYIHNVPSFYFLKALTKTVLLKDIQTLFVLVFTGSFTSLSLPLLLSGSSFFSLEFFIYENLKNPALWSQALAVILFQSFFIFIICWRAFSQNSSFDKDLSDKRIHLIPSRSFLIIPIFAVMLSIGGLFFISDKTVFVDLLSLSSFILSAGVNSITLSLIVGFLTLFLLTALCLSYQNVKARRFIASFTPPGVSFMGLAFLLIPIYTQTAVLIKWAIGLTLLLFPWIYRFRGERALDKMGLQVETGRFLGSDEWLIFTDILWPANRALFFLCAGITSFWACGDFSYSLIVSSGHWNLSLVVYDFFSSYRLEEAILLSWLLLFISFIVFLFWLALAVILDKNKKFSIRKLIF